MIFIKLRLKNIVGIFAALLILLSNSFIYANDDSKKEKKQKLLITVNQYVNHIALDAAYDGLKTELEKSGLLPDKVELIYGNAQGSISNAVQISKYHASLGPKFMVAIATPSVQTNIKARTGQETIAFLAVTDPVLANINWQENIIGVTDKPEISELIDLCLYLFKDLKTIGVVYNAGEINSVKIVNELKEIAINKNLDIKTTTVSNTSDIKSALSRLVNEVDIVYIPQDNTLISALESIVAIAKKSKIALVANDPTLVDRGLLMGLGTNYFNSGRQLGKMIIKMINNEDLNQKIQNPEVNELRINRKMFKQLGIIVPEEIVKDKRFVE